MLEYMSRPFPHNGFQKDLQKNLGANKITCGNLISSDIEMPKYCNYYSVHVSEFGILASC